MTKSFAIRTAVATDAEAVARLAAALAHYENMPPSLFTEEAFCKGNGLAFTCIVGEDVAGNVVGFALFYPGYDVASAAKGTHLADIFVEAEWRGLGLGPALLGHIARETLAAGGLWMSWTVLSRNEQALAFYQKLEAHQVDVRFLALGKSGLVKLASNSLSSSD